MIPNINEICTCCGGYENQPILQLFNDGCFRIADGKKVNGEFCINDFAFPTDGHTCLGLNVEVGGGEVEIFDNKINMISPATTLVSGSLYARGVIIRIVYPTLDENGEDLNFTDKSVKLSIQTADTLSTTEYPLYDFFSIFTNPKSNKAEDLINKITVINPSTLFKVRVVALVLFGQAE